jgi:hypothetical protein
LEDQLNSILPIVPDNIEENNVSPSKTTFFPNPSKQRVLKHNHCFFPLPGKNSIKTEKKRKLFGFAPNFYQIFKKKSNFQQNIE